MVAAVDLRVTQGTVLSAANGPALNLRVTQGTILVAAKSAAISVAVTQGAVLSLPSGPAFTLRVTQGTVLALYTIGSGERKLRAWGFSLDGHDFYVLRLGTSSTLVYDLTTGQWSRWASASSTYLRAHLGQNWPGLAKTTLDQGYAWNVVGADDTTGNLWILDPNYGRDDTTTTGSLPYTRQAIGALPMRLRKSDQCGAVYLLANLGAPAITGDTVLLETSDDSGFNWTNQGTISVTTGDTSQELSWLGLGLITSPGRMFRITDTGAIGRISSLDMT